MGSFQARVKKATDNEDRHENPYVPNGDHLFTIDEADRKKVFIFFLAHGQQDRA